LDVELLQFSTFNFQPSIAPIPGFPLGCWTSRQGGINSMLVPLRGIGRWMLDVLVSGLQSTVSLPPDPLFSVAKERYHLELLTQERSTQNLMGRVERKKPLFFDFLT